VIRRAAMSVVLLAGLVLAQSGVVTVTGRGPNRDAAISDAKRQAIEQVAGVALESYTQMENFQVLKDVVLARAKGYITSFSILTEAPFPNRFEVQAQVAVSDKQVEADARSLAQWLGGLRFLVVYDPDEPKTAEDVELYEYSRERINEYLARHGFRYIEKNVFDRLKEEAVKIAGADLSSIDYAKKLAFYADAEFFVYIDKLVTTVSGQAMGAGGRKTTIDLKAYDNCLPGEGLGVVVGEGDWKVDWQGPEAARKAVDPAARIVADKLFYLTLDYLGEWVNNGAPFELRFYGVDEDRMDSLLGKFTHDQDFGGQLEPVMSGDYWRLNCTFKKTPTEMRQRVRGYAQQVGMPLETRLQYVRQLSFAAKGVKVPAADEKKRADEVLQAPARK
jgi:hypothetical protein